MNYVDARHLIRSGDLLAWSSAVSYRNWHDFQVSMIRLAGATEYTHVGLAWAEHERVFVLEAVGSGVRLMPLSREVPFFWIPRPKPLSEGALQWAFGKIGNRYESKWKMVLNKIWSQRLDENDDWYCSEFVLGVLRADGELLTSESDPKDVVRAASEKWSLKPPDGGRFHGAVVKITA